MGGIFSPIYRELWKNHNKLQSALCATAIYYIKIQKKTQAWYDICLARQLGKQCIHWHARQETGPARL